MYDKEAIPNSNQIDSSAFFTKPFEDGEEDLLLHYASMAHEIFANAKLGSNKLTIDGLEINHSADTYITDISSHKINGKPGTYESIIRRDYACYGVFYTLHSIGYDMENATVVIDKLYALDVNTQDDPNFLKVVELIRAKVKEIAVQKEIYDPDFEQYATYMVTASHVFNHISRYSKSQ